MRVSARFLAAQADSKLWRRGFLAQAPSNRSQSDVYSSLLPTGKTLPWTPNANIKTGSSQENRLGVEVDGRTITIYANNFQIAQLTDSEYSEGRFGIFVQSGPTVNFKYFVNEVAYWELE